VFEGILEALAASGVGDGAIQMIDSAAIRAHQHECRSQKRGANTTPQVDHVAASAPKSMC
jgi:hypothetical protein